MLRFAGAAPDVCSCGRTPVAGRVRKILIRQDDCGRLRFDDRHLPARGERCVPWKASGRIAAARTASGNDPETELEQFTIYVDNFVGKGARAARMRRIHTLR